MHAWYSPIHPFHPRTTRVQPGWLTPSPIALRSPRYSAVFEAQHVDLQLKSLVAGESIINDGLSVVMYEYYLPVYCTAA